MVAQSLSGIWVSKPLLRLLIPFISGILIGRAIQSNYELLLYSTGFTLTVVSAFIIEYKAKTIILRIASGYLFLLSLLFVGAFLFEINCFDQRSNFYGHYTQGQNETVFQVQIDEEPDNVKLGQRAFANVQQVFLNDQQKSIETIGRILLYFKNDSTQKQPFRYGDRIVLHAKISEFSKPKNPGDFDYGQYLILNKVYRVAYINSNQILSLQNNRGNWLKTQSLKLKHDFITNLTQFKFFDGVAGIVAALVTGDSGITDPDLKSKFAATGTLHVLAVSGLHVGIIYVLLTWITGFLVQSKNGKLIQLFTILLVLWLYAFFTGFSPSVTRAATMFSLISVGQQFGRKIYTINILSATAMIMLAYNPMQLYSVGMQLSFSALAGILILTPHLSKIYTFKNNWYNKAYQLMCASFAAQLFTLPFSLFYFHQFSTYFLIANLVAIPLISIIASISFISFFVGIFPIFQKAIWFVLDYFVHALNLFIDFVANLPFAVFTYIPFDSLQFTVLILGLIILVYMIEMKDNRMIFPIISCIVFIFIWLPVKEIVSNKSSILILHHSSKMVMKVKKGINTDYFSAHFDETIHKQIKQQLQNKVENWQFHAVDSNIQMIFVPQFGTFAWIDSLSRINNIPKSDFLIIHHPQFLPKDFDDLPRYKHVVFTAKKYNYHKYRWKKYFESINQPYFEMKNEGYFSLNLQNL